MMRFSNSSKGLKALVHFSQGFSFLIFLEEKGFHEMTVKSVHRLNAGLS